MNKKIVVLCLVGVCFAIPASAGEAPAEYAAVVNEFGGASGAARASMLMLGHLQEKTSAALELAIKEHDELIYWREYFAGMKPKR